MFKTSKIICVAAVDFKRLEQAWYQKYGTDKKSEEEGRSYLQKIFQVRIGMPTPSEEQLEEFYQSLLGKSENKEINSKILSLLIQIGPKNPRAIKRMMNLAAFRMSQLEEQKIESQSAAIFWTVLEVIVHENIHRVFQMLEKTMSTESEIKKILAAPPIRVMFTEPDIGRYQVKIQIWIENFVEFLNQPSLDKEKFKKQINKLNTITQAIQ
ncbi:P-loop NTPase fold protein [Nitrosopumilus sp.]|uniref:P-loop NTPase fold protein n=1 Tax=Nitrosopumilus sp. TaxID=2024843 RepID=UPI003B5CA937